jgi:DNA-nicking Smr family endonuclease
MKRSPRPEELHLWAKVAATVRPRPGRSAPTPLLAEALVQTPPPAAPHAAVHARPVAAKTRAKPASPEAIEPGRLRRLTRERDEIGPRLDLHGLNQDQALVALAGFLRRAQEEGWRSVLVITGKGLSGDGVLRRRAPEWFAAPGLRERIAGVSIAHRRHGGDGAFYVALKRPAGRV